MSRIAILVCVVLVSGCATVTTGQNQSVSVDAPNCPQASCVLTNKDGTFHVASTPGTTMVNKSCSSLTVECSKPGYPDHIEEVSAGFQSMTVGNILIGGLIGVGVDAITGAACKYPSMIPVAMDCGRPDDVALTEMESDIPSFVWEAAYEGRCGDLEFLEEGEDGEQYYSAICQSEDTLLTCVDEECVRSEHSADASSGSFGTTEAENQAVP